MTGGGDLSLGDTGQRGVSLISDVTSGFCGIGALIVDSEVEGSSFGVDAADNALWVAAAEGGFAVVPADREGLGSCELFFLDLPGPAAERLEGLLLNCGLIGDDSLERAGELVADGVRLGWGFFATAVDDDDDESRISLDVVEVSGTIDEPAAVISAADSAVTCGASELGVKDVLSIVAA